MTKNKRTAARIRNAWRNTAGVASAARLLGCQPDKMHGYLIIGHVHDEAGECDGGITMAGNAEQAMAVGLAAAALIETQRIADMSGHRVTLPDEFLAKLYAVLGEGDNRPHPKSGPSPYL